MHLPLARLELTRTARRRSTHGLRFVAPAFCVGALLLVWFFMTLTESTVNDMADVAGSFLSGTVLAFLLFTGCILGPLFASGAIATEKQERSLGLLLLTNIRGSDLLVAKGITVFLQVELLAIGCLPLQAIASLLGGLTLKMLIGQQIAAAALCLLTTSLGLFCSTLAWRAIDAFFVSVGLLVAWFLLAFGADYVFLEPAGLGTANGLSLLTRTTDPSFAFDAVLRNGLYSIVFALAVFALIWVRLPRLSDDTAMRHRTTRGRPRYSAWLDRIRYFRLNPVDLLYAASAAGVGGTLYRWPWWPFVVVVMTVLAIVPVLNIAGLLSAILIVYDGVSCITSVRKNGGADTLFLTGAASHHIARGIHRTHFRRALLFLPALLAGDVSYYLLVLTYASPQLTETWQLWLSAASLVVSMAGSVVCIYAYTSLACIASTWRNNPAILTFKAILALFAVYILSYMVTIVVSIAVSIYMTPAASSTAQVLLTVPATLVLLAFAGAWQSRFGHKLARRWRTGAET